MSLFYLIGDDATHWQHWLYTFFVCLITFPKVNDGPGAQTEQPALKTPSMNVIKGIAASIGGANFLQNLLLWSIITLFLLAFMFVVSVLWFGHNCHNRSNASCRDARSVQHQDLTATSLFTDSDSAGSDAGELTLALNEAQIIHARNIEAQHQRIAELRTQIAAAESATMRAHDQIVLIHEEALALRSRLEDALVELHVEREARKKLEEQLFHPRGEHTEKQGESNAQE